MKNLSYIILKTFNSILIGLLTILGFSCSNEDDQNIIICEYGSPYAHFYIKGKVTDEQNNPVSNAQILVKSPDTNHEWLQCDTLYTNQQGAFELKKSDFPVSKYRFITSAEEGKERLLANDTTLVSFSREDFKDGERWFEGNVEKDIKITLKKYVDTHTSPYTLYTVYGRVTDKDGYPLAGILITSLPSYTFNNPDDPYSYPAITDYNGNYSLTYDKATATEHTIYASLYMGWWNWEAHYGDSVTINFADIPLSGGKDLLIGKGKKELNFVLRDKAYK